jgi:hypothetical protein
MLLCLAVKAFKLLVRQHPIKRQNHLSCLVLCVVLMLQPLMSVRSVAQTILVMSALQTEQNHDCCEGKESTPMKHDKHCADCASFLCGMSCMSRCDINAFAQTSLLLEVFGLSAQPHFSVKFPPYQSHIASGLDRPPKA